MFRSVVVLIVHCLFVATALATVPTSITIQGRLTDSGGTPLAPGFKILTFRIFDASSNGTQLWPAAGGEAQTVTSSSEGLWIAIVGALSPLSETVFADTVRWLEVNVDDGVNPAVTMPRVRLVTGPYAFRVATVDRALGGAILSKVSIGPGNTNPGIDAFVAGSSNDAIGHWSTVAGGQDNYATGGYSVVAGGSQDTASGDQSTVSGGQLNTASGDKSTISGGQSNLSSGQFSAIGGGSSNVASARWATVAGGQVNTATDTGATIGGGRDNEATGRYSTVAGGGSPSATEGNLAYGDFSMIPGGTNNEASGRFSLAAGRSAKAMHAGAFVWGDSTASDFASTAINQFLIRAGGGVGIGTNAPESPLHVFESSAGAVTANSSSTLVLERNSINYISILAPDHTTRGIYFGDPNDPNSGGVFYASSTEDGLDFRTNGNTTRMIIDSLGNVGIGTVTPNAKLEINGGLQVDGTLNVATSVGALIVPRLTTTQRNAISAQDGMIIYNLSTDQFNFRENGAWVTK